MHWVGDVLDLLFANVVELNRKLIHDLLMHCPRNADATGLSEPFQAGRDVDTVAQKVALALHHVADGDADTKIHLPACWIRKIAGAQTLLDIDRTAHGIDGAWKLGQHSVAGSIEDAP